jgi:hypothetical protein
VSMILSRNTDYFFALRRARLWPSLSHFCLRSVLASFANVAGTVLYESVPIQSPHITPTAIMSSGQRRHDK